MGDFIWYSSTCMYNSNFSSSWTRNVPTKILSFELYPYPTLVATHAKMRMSLFWNDGNDWAFENKSMFGRVSTINGTATQKCFSSRWSRSIAKTIIWVQKGRQFLARYICCYYHCITSPEWWTVFNTFVLPMSLCLWLKLQWSYLSLI